MEEVKREEEARAAIEAILNKKQNDVLSNKESKDIQEVVKQKYMV